MFVYKLQKNIIQPIFYYFQSKFGYMPKAEVLLGDKNDPVVNYWHGSLTNFNKLFILFSNKKIAVSCLDISQFQNEIEYFKIIKGKNSADYFTRRALKKGYFVNILNRNNFIDDIFEINTSSEFRQNKKMTLSYRKKVLKYDDEVFNTYYGIFTKEGKLVGYANIIELSQAAFIYKILGHKKFLDDSIMYLLITSLISEIIKKNNSNNVRVKYVFYDSFLTNSKGLTLFKKRFGFIPYMISWKMN